MYEFINIDELPTNNELSIQTILDGVNLDHTLQGYTTLSVHGRELLSRNIATQDFRSVSGGGKRRTSTSAKGMSLSGNKFIGSSLPSRTIRVEYMLRADSNKAFRQLCERMNYHLHNEQMRVQFTDDMEYEYIGTLSTVSDIDAVSNSVAGAFEIECSDPFKTSVSERQFTFDTIGKFNYYTLYPAIFSTIEIVIQANTNVFKLYNMTTSEAIIINDDFAINDKIVIDKTKNTIIKNGVDIFHKLALMSDLEDFGAIYGDDLQTNIASLVDIKFKERRL